MSTSYWGVDHGDEISKASERSLGFISNAKGKKKVKRVSSGPGSAVMQTQGWDQLKRTEGSAMESVTTGRHGKRGQSVESFKGTGVSKSFWGVEHGDEIAKAYDFRRSENNTRRQNAAMGGAAGAVGGAAGYALGSGAMSGGLRRARAAHRLGGTSLGRRAVGFGVAGGAAGAAANAMIPAKKKQPTVSKSDKARRYIGTNTALGVISPTVGVGHSAVKAKKGRKLGAAGTTFGHQTVGGVGGVLGGALLSRGRTAGMVAGGTLGTAGGSYTGAVSNVQHGRIKGLKAEKYPMQRSKKRS